MQQAHPDAAVQAPPRPQDSLGCALNQLEKDQQLGGGGGATFYRKRTGAMALSHVATPGSDRGYLVGVSLRPGHQRRILHDGHASTHAFDVGAVYVRDFAEDYRADLHGAFDFLLLELPRATFERACDDRIGSRVRGLQCVTGLHDAVLGNLAQALLPALERPQEASALFMDQLGSVMATHVIEQYGTGASTGRSCRNASHGGSAGGGPRLSPVHAARAREMLRSRLDGSVSVADIADACRLSRSYFIRAFRATTGQTPHQWLLHHRIEVARRLLLEPGPGPGLSLAEIAAACGFADQSHFTRVFMQVEGQPPGSWRREHR